MKLLTCILVVFPLSGCVETQNFNLDGTEPFTLVIRNFEKEGNSVRGNPKEYLIKPESKEYKAFNAWLGNNREGWKKEPRKWLSPYDLYGKNYRLQFSKEAAYLRYELDGDYLHCYKNIDSSLVDIFNELDAHNNSFNPDGASTAPPS